MEPAEVGSLPGEQGAPHSLGTVALVLTGASWGLGRTLALQLGLRVTGPGSCFLLLARSGGALASLAGELGALCLGLEVRCEETDLGTKEGLRRAQRAAQEMPWGTQRLLLINNAGSLGDISKYFLSLTNPAEVNNYMFLNITSPMCLTSAVLEACPKWPRLHRTVVNISSLCALQPVNSFALYCTGKAARDMMFQVLAAEEPDVRVLNYAPGPLDTDMYQLVITESIVPEVRQKFENVKNSGKVLDCRDSAEKLMKLLMEDKFQSGAHIDVYDI